MERRLPVLAHGGAVAGDATAAFAGLVAATRPQLLAVARRYVDNDDDANDIVQDAYLRAWRARGGFRGDALPSTWLYAIVMNQSRTFLRDRTRDLSDPADLDEVTAPHAAEEPERTLEEARIRDEINRAVVALPARQREVLVLKDAGFSHAAIATRLGISVSAAKVMLHRARLHLRRSLSGCVAGVEPAARRPA